MPEERPVVIVLCGGTSRRLGGRDKTRESLGRTTVMDHLLNALPSGWAVICVGEERATTRSVEWCRESPAGGGPVAGIAAALQHLDAANHHAANRDCETCDSETCDSEIHDSETCDSETCDYETCDSETCDSEIRDYEIRDSETCVVVGGDMPFAATAVPTLTDALNARPELDAVLASDPDGRTQPLLAAYRLEALRAALPSDPGGARLMALIGALVISIVDCEPRITLDVDTPEALEQARHIVGA